MNSHVVYDLFIKAQKAAARYDTQLVRVMERKWGLNTKLYETSLEEDVIMLRKREIWAKKQILAFNNEVRVLKRYYDLSSSQEVRTMIYDFLDTVNHFCYKYGKVADL